MILKVKMMKKLLLLKWLEFEIGNSCTKKKSKKFEKIE